jgi:hypothetical protein
VCLHLAFLDAGFARMLGFNMKKLHFKNRREANITVTTVSENNSARHNLDVLTATRFFQ